MRKRKKLHPTGQLSIFIVLIFQALFILFAMSLNVALVVHDKINLQNSVDVAAYYGAMKQAEMMNAIGHINYQIRQSWKLLVWRYHVLGSMGVTGIAPNKDSFISNTDSDHSFQVFSSPTPGPYFFCVGHEWWGGYIGQRNNSNPSVKEDDNLCTTMSTNISAVSVPTIGGTLGSFASMLFGVRDLSNDINNRNMDICELYGFNSWLLGIMSFFHFRIDQSHRKFMIRRLAEILRDGRELDGGLIQDGVKKTFENNLSYINKQNYQSQNSKLEQFSSLEGRAPQDWLADEPFFDLGLYARLEPKSGGGCDKSFDFLNNPPGQAANTGVLTNAIARFSTWPCNDPNACNPSAGIYKKENFLVFYSVRAEIPYKNQIFLPLSRNITLKAKAYAKPFGGIIGPPPILPGTSQRTDNRLPPSSLPSATSPDVFDRTAAPNYSRYPGDPWGLRSRSVHHHWLMKRTVRNRPPGRKNVGYYLKEAYRSPPDNDPLAKNTIPGGQYGMGIDARAWEVEAISPDLFDVTYFTILPHYQHAYFPKILKLLGPQEYIRADLGMTRTGLNDFTGKTLLAQVNASSQNGPFYVIQNRNRHNTFTSLPNQPTLLLSGWNPPKRKYKDSDTYEPNPGSSNLGRCFHWANLSNPDDPLGKIANGCVYGGRTGYSVKMVSDDFIKELGTQGGFNLSNPTPPWWNE